MKISPFKLAVNCRLTVNPLRRGSHFAEQLDRLPDPDPLAARLANTLGDETLTGVYWPP